MKKHLLIVAAAAGFFYLSLSSFQLAPTYKAQNLNCTEGPGSGGTCSSAGAGCHDAVTHTLGTTKITVRKKSLGMNSAAVTEYQNDSTYYVTISVKHPSLNSFGIQAEVLNDSDKNYGVTTAAGHLTGDTIGGLYVVSSNKIPGADSATFEWKAPSSDTADVMVYGAGAMCNDDGSPMNDSLFKLNTATLTWIPTPNNVAELKKGLEIAAYPNPITGNVLNIKLLNNSTGNFNVTAYNVNGQKIYQSKVNISNPGKYITINTENWAKGMYILNVSGAQTTGAMSITKP